MRLLVAHLSRCCPPQGLPTYANSAWRWSIASAGLFRWKNLRVNLRDHIVGLNLGRWDYMASLILSISKIPSGVLSRPQHYSTQRGLLSEFTQSPCGDLPQTRSSHRRHDRFFYPARRMGTERAGIEDPCGDKKNEANRWMDGG